MNSKQPPECPYHIGPPCPPCYSNEAQDYKNGDSINFDTEQQQKMGEFIEFYTNWWFENYPPEKTSDGYNIFEGSAGRGDIFLRLFQYDNMNTTYLNTASEYIDHALKILPSTQQYTSFSFSFHGVWTLKAIIESINNNQNSMQQYINLIVDNFNDINNAISTNSSKTPKYGMDMTHFSINTGLAGCLYNALLLNKYFNKTIIDITVITNLVYFILDSGIATGSSRGHNYLEYLHPFIDGCYCWGADAGSSGVVKMIYESYNMYPNELKNIFEINSKYYIALKNTIDFYVSIQLDDDNMPTDVSGACQQYYGTDEDARVQWCHGCPGFINVFVMSSILFYDSNSTLSEIYLNSGMRCSNATWDRGLLVKGTMYCHGIGGNIYMFWELYELLGKMKEIGIKFDKFDLEFLQNQSAFRAKQFVLWTLDWNNINKTRIYDSNSGDQMHQGNFAIPMLYIQTMTDHWPQNVKVCTPIWNLCV